MLKELEKAAKKVEKTGEAVFFVKNNKNEAVLLSYSEYEYLKNLEDALENIEIENMIEERMKNHDPSKDISWEELKARRKNKK